MQYIHVKSLEDYNPGYKDRSLIWCKVYFSMLNSDPEFEMIEEIDKWRYVAFIMIELQTKQPIPYNKDYLARKGFNNRKRSIDLTLKMLHNFVEVRNDGVTQSRVDKSRVEEKRVEKSRYMEFVLLTVEEYEKLINLVGEHHTKRYIEQLNNYIGSKGKKYASHYHTIYGWITKNEPELITQYQQEETVVECTKCGKRGRKKRKDIVNPIICKECQ